MRKADFKARIKKIEIANKVFADSWAQSIRLILDDIELTNENLLELRQFKPNELVNIIIKPLQLTLFDDVQAPPAQAGVEPSPASNQELAVNDRQEEDEQFISFKEDDADVTEPPGKLVKAFKV